MCVVLIVESYTNKNIGKLIVARGSETPSKLV
jgi:hypothetical protein